MSSARARLVTALASRFGASTVPTMAANEVELEVSARDFADAVASLRRDRGRLLALYGSDERREPEGAIRVRAVFGLEADDLLVVIRAPLHESRALPSSVAAAPAAAWPEREMRELLGIEPQGHPDLRPLLHFAPPPGARPAERTRLRGVAADAAAPGNAGAPPRGADVEGEGVQSLEVGPVAGLVAESWSMRLALLGERLVHGEPLLFFKHRGVEARAEGASAAHLVALAERICGRCGPSAAAATAQALERLAGSEPPERGQWLRTAVLELDRASSHAAAIAGQFAAVGLEAAQARVLRSREALLGECESAFGSRLLFGTIGAGGMRRDVDAAAARLLARAVRAVAADSRRLVDAALETPSFVEMLEGVGTLPASLVAALDLAGPAARASGSRRDSRRDHPYLAYGGLRFWVPLYGQGDALARFRLQADELQQSASLAEETLENLPPGPAMQALSALEPRARANGLVESPRGPALHAVHTDDRGRIARYHVRSPSVPLWPALAAILPGSLAGDLPVVAESFSLCVACVDR